MAAPSWKGMLKWSAWLLGGALAIPVVCYVALLLINWRDQAPSEAALRLAADYRNRPAIPAADNAYVYVMGFEVAPDSDPRESGVRRIEWIRNLPPEARYPPSGDPVTKYVTYKSSRSPLVQKISDACRPGSQDCHAALDAGADEIPAWISSEQWLLDRYLTFLQHPSWLETLPFNGHAPLPDYGVMADGQKLLMAKAYLLADQKNVAAVRELLGNDVRFWRRVLASSDNLITKMVAVSTLNRTFEMGNLALRRLPPELQLAAMPEEWTAPISDSERSMLRCWTGEWIASGRLFEQTIAAGAFDTVDSESDAGYFSNVAARAAMPLFKLQNTQNLQAEMFVRAAAALDVPYEHFPEALDRARPIFEDPNSGSNFFANLHNPLGRILLLIGVGNHTSYPPRVADVEGVRRAAVLTTELRARGVTQQNIAAELATSPTRSPYSGEPFTWDAEKQAIVFVGMEPSERGRHAFIY